MDALESDDHDRHGEACTHLQDEFDGVSEEDQLRAEALFEERLGRKRAD
jgi:hypothetical protein